MRWPTFRATMKSKCPARSLVRIGLNWFWFSSKIGDLSFWTKQKSAQNLLVQVGCGGQFYFTVSIKKLVYESLGRRVIVSLGGCFNFNSISLLFIQKSCTKLDRLLRRSFRSHAPKWRGFDELGVVEKLKVVALERQPTRWPQSEPDFGSKWPRSNS